MTHSKAMGCAVYCTVIDPVMTLYSSSVGRAFFFKIKKKTNKPTITFKYPKSTDAWSDRGR